jgi:hypothetical protein
MIRIVSVVAVAVLSQGAYAKGGAVDVILIGKQANGEKKKRCKEHIWKSGGKLDKASPIKAYIDVEPGKNFLKIVSATRGTVTEERLPGSWNVGDLCKDALMKAQRELAKEEGAGGSDAGPVASGDPKALIEQGNQALERGAFAEAIRYLGGAFKQSGDPKLHKGLGRAYLGKGKAAGSVADLKIARDHFHKARDLAKDDVEADLKSVNEEIGKNAK